MCLVCGSPDSEPHFGGISCRACAAFFRRFFVSPKINKICNCKKRTKKSHPCRLCRIEKCLKIGMTPDKIQHCRDKIVIDLSSSPSEDLISTRIIPRTTSNLESAIHSWQEFEKLRFKNTAIEINEYNLFMVTSWTKMDTKLIWDMTDKIFPATRKLKISDRKALLRNFILKFWQIWPIFDYIKNPDDYENVKKNDYKEWIVGWYGGCFEKGKEMSNKEIVSLFEPFWSTFYTQIVPPIVGLKLENEELMAIVWLLFFDNAYTNISPECEEMCRNIKKVILRELKNYQIDKNFEEMRLLDTVETLELIEKSEQKFLEEMLICEMHHIRIHDDFKSILRENRF
ncbi:hypothetical protein B9Z55_027771 [Caenorhabditis nigoni]|uniref:Nuclear receptor domain-containing protein n=1 Tax=Caenorhabditis nigoni TaxID=1611254 RepID=A0A2G5SEN5_9PELO|nr:hypothetical protein B9Z55_027771 [Caenorhabditis nigoni]